MVDITSNATLAMVCWCGRTGSPGQRAQQSERGRSGTAPISQAPPPTSQGPVPTCLDPRLTSPLPAPVCLVLAAGSQVPTPTWQLSLPWQRGKGQAVPGGVKTGSPGTTDLNRQHSRMTLELTAACATVICNITELACVAYLWSTTLLLCWNHEQFQDFKSPNFQYVDDLMEALAKCLSVPILFAFMIKHQIGWEIYFLIKIKLYFIFLLVIKGLPEVPQDRCLKTQSQDVTTSEFLWTWWTFAEFFTLLHFVVFFLNYWGHAETLQYRMQNPTESSLQEHILWVCTVFKDQNYFALGSADQWISIFDMIVWVSVFQIVSVWLRNLVCGWWDCRCMWYVSVLLCFQKRWWIAWNVCVVLHGFFFKELYKRCFYQTGFYMSLFFCYCCCLVYKWQLNQHGIFWFKNNALKVSSNLFIKI